MKCFEDRYIHIKEAMDQFQITIDAAAARTYLKELKKRVLSKVVKENKTQVKKYFKKVHKVIENIEKGEFNYSVSMSNHRVNSVFTSMKRELRYFLRTNGESMIEVDISTSHPFTLATILTEKFFTETKGGYNLYSIFPQYYKSFKYSCEAMEYQDFLKNLLDIWL
jgi:phenylalanyl-tRNA synthetase alpha subunit